MKTLFSFFIILMIVTALVSCRDDYSICNSPKEVNFYASFYQKQGNVDVAVPAPVLSIMLLNAPAALYSQQVNTATFSLALNPATDSARYIIKVAANLPSDTFTVVYNSINTIISADCGSAYFNNISRLYSTLNTIDSIKVIKPLVNNELLVNAKIYF